MFCAFRYGRKNILLLSYVSAIIFSVASAVSSSFIMFSAFRFLTGFSLSGISIVAIVLSESTSLWVLTLAHTSWGLDYSLRSFIRFTE